MASSSAEDTAGLPKTFTSVEAAELPAGKHASVALRATLQSEATKKNMSLAGTPDARTICLAWEQNVLGCRVLPFTRSIRFLERTCDDSSGRQMRRGEGQAHGARLRSCHISILLLPLLRKTHLYADIVLAEVLTNEVFRAG